MELINTCTHCRNEVRLHAAPLTTKARCLWVFGFIGPMWKGGVSQRIRYCLVSPMALLITHESFTPSFCQSENVWVPPAGSCTVASSLAFVSEAIFRAGFPSFLALPVFTLCCMFPASAHTHTLPPLSSPGQGKDICPLGNVQFHCMGGRAPALKSMEWTQPSRQWSCWGEGGLWFGKCQLPGHMVLHVWQSRTMAHTCQEAHAVWRGHHHKEVCVSAGTLTPQETHTQPRTSNPAVTLYQPQTCLTILQQRDETCFQLI